MKYKFLSIFLLLTLCQCADWEQVTQLHGMSTVVDSFPLAAVALIGNAASLERIDGVQRLVTTAACLMQRLGHHPLAGARRPQDQHGHLHGGHAARLDQQLLHLGVAGLDEGLPLMLLFRAGQTQGVLYGDEQLVLVDGLG